MRPNLRPKGTGRLFRATGEGALEFAERASASRDELTSELRLLYAALRDGGDDAGIKGGQLREVLSGVTTGPAPTARIRSPEFSARLMRVLKEAGCARTEGSDDARTAGVVSSEKIDLQKSPTFAACARAHRDRVRYLRQSNRPTS